MKKNCAIMLLSVSGLATAASAQNFSLTLVPSVQTIDTSAGAVTMTMSVFGDADVGTHMWGGSFGIESDSSNVTDMRWNPASWSAYNIDGGYLGNGNYNEVIFGQLVTGPNQAPWPGSENGMLIGSFEVLLSGFGLVDFELQAGSEYTLVIVDQFTGGFFYDTYGSLSLGSTQILLVPSPGVGPVLAIAGLVVTRRRRLVAH